MKRIIMATTLLILSGLSLPLGWTEVVPPAASEIADLGNRVCPVSGDKVSGKHFVVYKGKRYGLCCPHCEKEFMKDPEKYIATLGTTQSNHD